MVVEIAPGAEGLELTVDGRAVAQIVEKNGLQSLVFAIRGPMELEQARQTVCGLIDLLIAFDSSKGKPSGRPS